MLAIFVVLSKLVGKTCCLTISIPNVFPNLNRHVQWQSEKFKVIERGGTWYCLNHRITASFSDSLSRKTNNCLTNIKKESWRKKMNPWLLSQLSTASQSRRDAVVKVESSVLEVYRKRRTHGVFKWNLWGFGYHVESCVHSILGHSSGNQVVR